MLPPDMAELVIVVSGYSFCIVSLQKSIPLGHSQFKLTFFLLQFFTIFSSFTKLYNSSTVERKSFDQLALQFLYYHSLLITLCVSLFSVILSHFVSLSLYVCCVDILLSVCISKWVCQTNFIGSSSHIRFIDVKVSRKMNGRKQIMNEN
jgi:hypothetical protein